LPDKTAVQQLKDGVGSYVDGVAWGASAIAARFGAFGPGAQQEAKATNGLVSEAADVVAINPGLALTLAGGYASKYPFQVASRLALGSAVSYFFTPYVGIPTTGVALYGNAFKAADQHVEGLVMALTVGEVCNGKLEGQP
jgi:hypothetical protein